MAKNFAKCIGCTKGPNDGIIEFKPGWNEADAILIPNVCPQCNSTRSIPYYGSLVLFDQTNYLCQRCLTDDENRDFPNDS